MESIAWKVISRYMPRAVIEAEAPGVYELLPAQFRDRLPSEVWASPLNTKIFRASLSVMPRLVNELFARLRYTEGLPWPMWKLVAAFYLVEGRIGQTSVLQAGEKIYATMPWPPDVRSITDALWHTETAYFEAHMRALRSAAGCWRVEFEGPSRLVIADDTPYPCHLQEGVIAGICRAFAHQHPVYRLLEPYAAKRAGGTVTRYQVDFTPL